MKTAILLIRRRLKIVDDKTIEKHTNMSIRGKKKDKTGWTFVYGFGNSLTKQANGHLVYDSFVQDLALWLFSCQYGGQIHHDLQYVHNPLSRVAQPASHKCWEISPSTPMESFKKL